MWWIPLGIGVVAPGLVYLALRRVLREMAALHDSVASIRGLAPEVAEVALKAQRTRRALELRDLR